MSDKVKKPENRFSHNKAHISKGIWQTVKTQIKSLNCVMTYYKFLSMVTVKISND